MLNLAHVGQDSRALQHICIFCKPLWSLWRDEHVILFRHEGNASDASCLYIDALWLIFIVVEKLRWRYFTSGPATANPVVVRTITANPVVCNDASSPELNSHARRNLYRPHTHIGCCPRRLVWKRFQRLVWKRFQVRMHTCERLRAPRVAPCACCTRALCLLLFLHDEASEHGSHVVRCA
jgi:hypothetical protein